jgi:hypothetical protein
MGFGLPEFKTSKIEKKVAGGKSSKKTSVVTKYYSTIRVNNQSFQVLKAFNRASLSSLSLNIFIWSFSFLNYSQLPTMLILSLTTCENLNTHDLLQA